MSRTLLVDADVIAFKIASVIEKQVCDDDGYIHFWWADEGEGRDKVDIYLSELVQDMHADEVVICLSDPSSHYFRHDIYPDYKANRTGKRPLVLKALKEHMADSGLNNRRAGRIRNSNYAGRLILTSGKSVLAWRGSWPLLLSASTSLLLWRFRL